MSDDNKILDLLDWEDFTFPLKLTNIKSENGFYNIRKDSQITIWRNDEFKLTGKVEGIIDNKNSLFYKNRIPTKGLIVNGETFICSLSRFENFKLVNCLVIPKTFKPTGTNNEYHFTAKLKLREIIKFNNTDDEIDKTIDWNICSPINYRFPRITTRTVDKFPYKHRGGNCILPEDKPLLKSNISLKRDFLRLRILNRSVIVQSIDAAYLPGWAGGIAIEYNWFDGPVPKPQHRAGIVEFMGFIMGSKLLPIGSSNYNSDLKTVSAICASPWGNSIISGCSKTPMPPISFNSISEIEKSEEILSGLATKYLQLRDLFDLKDILWKLYLGRVQPLGTNLPILASGLESLAVKYISAKKTIKKYNKTEKKSYKKLIQPELMMLSKKLEGFQFKNFLLNKLNNPFSYGLGEKIKLFTNELEFNFNEDSIETKALQARNMMAHSSMSKISDPKLIEYMKYTNAYITLINRIILRILDYKGQYIDYYTTGFPRRSINENIPVK